MSRYPKASTGALGLGRPDISTPLREDAAVGHSPLVQTAERQRHQFDGCCELSAA